MYRFGRGTPVRTVDSAAHPAGEVSPRLPVVYHPDYVTPLPEGHRFPMRKFRRLYQGLCGGDLGSRVSVFRPRAAPRSWLRQVHRTDYVQRFLEGNLTSREERRIGLPWSPGLARRTRTAVGGTVLTARLALRYGLACNTAGGTHHAHAGFGAGFCVFNDIAVAARVLQAEDEVTSVLVIDLDVHQGDGTARIFQDDPTVFTFSVHCSANYPFEKQQSDRDVVLEGGSGDDDYIRSLEDHLPGVFRLAKPDLVLYDAGVDPHRRDVLGRLRLSDGGLRTRDRVVLRMCREQGIPVACVIGGGYDEVEPLSRRHALLHRVALEVLTA